MIDSPVEQEDKAESARRDLYEVYADLSVKPRRKRKLIESLDEIYGYDIAFLVGLIMRTEFSGNLNIISQSDELSGITFSNGRITKIDLNDKETIMGELIIKEGLIERGTLLNLLQNQAKPLGEILIENKIVTKEQLINILIKQMRLRLSKYINSNKYRMNFSEAETVDYGLSISYNEYLGLAHDWVAGRFSPDWLKLHYMELSEGVIDIPAEAADYSVIKTLPLLTDLSGFLSLSRTEKVFSKVLSQLKSDKDREYFLKCFHYGIMSGQIVLKNDPDAESQSDSILKNIYAACSKKTGLELLETLAHILKFKPTEIDSIFQAINSYVHAYSGDDYDMKNNMFRIVLEMLAKKQFYQDEMIKKYSITKDQTDNSAEILKKIDEVYNDLIQKNLFVAIDKLKKLNQFSAHTPKIKLYMVWAKGLMIHQNNIKINMSELDREFLQILPEDKDSAEYFYVRSILDFLKKDEPAALASYQQAIKMNQELKKYPPFKPTGSFIKNLFKLSVVLLLLFSSKITHAQEIKKNIQLPFVYLNQYFNYKIVNDDAVQINDTTYNLSDMSIERNTNKYQVNLNGTLDRFSVNPTFYEYSSKTKTLSPTKHSKVEKNFTVEGNENLETDFLCLIQKNQFTTLKICKSLAASAETGIQSYSANEQTLEPEGTIILNDITSTVVFSLVKKNNDFFELQTVKRGILPLKIDKSANSEEFKIQFIDSGKSRYAWLEKINLNQNYFNLKFDNLLDLKQGLLFKDTVTVETGISQVLIDKDKLQKKYYNKLIVSPLIVFEELSGKSSTVDAILRSDIGFGFSISVDRYLENSQNIFGLVSFYTSKLSPTNSSTFVNSGQATLLSLLAGYKYAFNEKWSASAMVRAEENLFFNQVNSNTVALTKSLGIMFGLAPEYMFYNKDDWQSSIDAGLFAILPTDVKDSTKTNMGMLFSGNFKASYKVNWGKLTAGLNLGNRSQKNDTYTYNDSYLIYKVGLNYLF